MSQGAIVTSKWQVSRFAFIFLNAEVSIFLVPHLVSSSSYQAWVAVLGGGLLSLGVLACTYYIGNLQKHRAWVDFGRDIVGKWPHRAVLLLLACWCLLNVSINIEHFVLFFGSNYLRATPHWFIQVVLAVVIWSTVRHGFATLVYMADGLVLIIGAAMLLTVILFLQDANYQMLPAFIHFPHAPLAWKDTTVVASWLANWILFLFIMPELPINKTTFKNLAVAQLLVILVLLGGWLLTMLNFGPHLGRLLKYPYMDIIRSATHNNILGNIDPLLIGVWSSSLFIHSSFLIYVACRCTAALTARKSGPWLQAGLVAAAALLAWGYSRDVPLYEKICQSYGLVLIWLAIEGIPVYYSLASLWSYRKKRTPSPL